MEATLMPNGIYLDEGQDKRLDASIPLDYFGAIADSTIPKLLYSNTKKARRTAFREMDKLFRLAFGDNAKGRILHNVSFGTDADGVVRAFFQYSRRKEDN